MILLLSGVGRLENKEIALKRTFLVVLGLAVALASGGVRALNVAVFNDENAAGFATALTGFGHTVTTLSEAQVASGVNAYDVLVIGHHTSLSPASCTSITNFLNAGKRLVTEWNAVWNIFSASGASIYYNQGTQCALFPGTVDQGGNVGTNTPVTPTATPRAVMTGLPNPLLLGGGSQFFYLVSGYNPAVWTIAATYDGWALTGNPAVMYANYGAGQVAVGTFDYGDVVNSNANADLLLNNLVTQPLGPAAAPAGPDFVPTLQPLALIALALGLVALAWRRRALLRR
jgi:hypothetical protein